MKVFISYASCGAGHFKAAEAIYKYLTEHCQTAEVKLIDVLEKSNFFYRYSYTLGYSFFVSQALFLWRLAFLITNLKPLRKPARLIAVIINKLNTIGFAKFLIRQNPQYIISTHFLPAEVSSYLKKTGKISAKTITIITDFGVHPFWISEGTDIYIVASDFTKRQLLLEGIEESRIKEFGIPVAEKFLRRYHKDNLCKKLNIDNNQFTVLIITGSFGIGPIEEVVKELYLDAQLLVVCASNNKLYNRLIKRGLAKVKVFGFVDNMQELMAVSSVIITKPGGLTISEILNMELIPIFISAIPGQETANLQVLKEYGIGLCPTNAKEARNIVLDFKNHPEKLNVIKDKMRKIKKTDCLEKVCNVICQGSSRTSC